MSRDPLLRFQLLALPLALPCLFLVLVGLGSGDPWWVPGELLLLGLAGVVPGFWVQWRRPLVLWPWTGLAGMDREPAWLAGLGTRDHQVLTILVAVLLLVLNRLLYQVAPLFAGLSPLRATAPGSHLLGLLLGLVGMMGLGLTLQVGLAGVRLWLLSEMEQAELQGLPIPPLTHLFLPEGKQTHQQAGPE
ncbi:MAG: hypothetical protein Q6J68_03585 [Thermostichales cyanobacterium SZTDM-1c_bins_54]